MELRHQRNPDVFFDLFNPIWPNGIDNLGLDRIYSTIETLLPKAKISKTNKAKLLELFGGKAWERGNWISIGKINK